MGPVYNMGMKMNIKPTLSALLPAVFISLAALYGAACGGTQQASPIPTSTPPIMKQPIAPPTPTTFATSTNYEAFPSNLLSAFKAAVDLEFAAAPEKAGISVAVYTDGTLWAYATGQADETIAMTTRTPLFISSTSKTFLSALILTQLESGLYKLTDSLGTVLSICTR